MVLVFRARACLSALHGTSKIARMEKGIWVQKRRRVASVGWFRCCGQKLVFDSRSWTNHAQHRNRRHGSTNGHRGKRIHPPQWAGDAEITVCERKGTRWCPGPRGASVEVARGPELIGAVSELGGRGLVCNRHRGGRTRGRSRLSHVNLPLLLPSTGSVLLAAEFPQPKHLLIVPAREA